MSTKFEEFIQEILQEARTEGREAMDQLSALREYFRNVRKRLQETNRPQK